MFLFSIIAPVGLLMTLRLVGILQEPLTISETRILEAVKWELERPDHMIDIGDVVKSSYDNDCVSIAHSIFVDDYDDMGVYGSPYISLRINSTAILQTGFVNYVNVTFEEDYESSEVNFFEAQVWPKFYSHVENLSIIGYRHNLLGRGLKAFMMLIGVNYPMSIHFDGIVHWILRSPQNKTHLIDITIELVYYDGTAYKRIVQPFQLKIGPDDNNDFQTATEIKDGKYTGLYLSELDNVDYYKIYVIQGQRVKVYVNGPWTPQPLFNFSVYDPEGKTTVVMATPREWHAIDFISSSTGYWMIELRRMYAYGFYYIEVNE